MGDYRGPRAAVVVEMIKRLPNSDNSAPASSLLRPLWTASSRSSRLWLRSVDLVRGLPLADDRDAHSALAATRERNRRRLVTALIPPSCHGDARCFEPNGEKGTHRRCWGEYADRLGKPILVQGKT
jgi:hypothetical protein